MHRLSTSLSLLLASVFVSGQTTSFGQASAPKNLSNHTARQWIATRSQIPSNTGCPVGFTASRQANPQMMTAGDAKQITPAQGLHLTFISQGTDIASMEVTVFATSTQAGALPVASPSNAVISKTFELKRQSEAASLDGADVWMRNVGSISRADLISINYADGTTWHAGRNDRCDAIPSNFLLVGSR
jgi:hypothetical protein